MRKAAFTLLLLILVLITGLSIAQGAGYDIRWFSVDGGGVQGSGDGVNYTLSGLIGQSDLGVTTGNGYQLTGGGMLPVGQAQPVHVTIQTAGSGVLLDWVPDPENMAYEIYRSTTPYFVPQPANRMETVPVPAWMDSTPGIIGNPAVNYFYLLRCTRVGTHADANRTGEFDFALVPGQ